MAHCYPDWLWTQPLGPFPFAHTLKWRVVLFPHRWRVLKSFWPGAVPLLHGGNPLRILWCLACCAVFFLSQESGLLNLHVLCTDPYRKVIVCACSTAQRDLQCTNPILSTKPGTGSIYLVRLRCLGPQPNIGPHFKGYPHLFLRIYYGELSVLSIFNSLVSVLIMFVSDDLMLYFSYCLTT